MIIVPGGFGGGGGNGTAPPFGAQRLILIALLMGMACYAVVVGVLLSQQDWVGLAEPGIEILETVSLAVGGAALVGALVLRSVLSGRAEAAAPEQRPLLAFQARLMPVAILEGGVLLSITAWMLNGGLMPYVAVAGVLFAIAILFVPFTDPDAQ
ncbi:MAG: hypothetical protein H6838_09525 [Planctomycetes bacterium]|nr:hypothetical protein [Planctomycetota bacterium]MCB9885721.1 hypothetical protein [Planctomycetota bacterium]